MERLLPVLLALVLGGLFVWTNLRVGYIVGAWRGRGAGGILLALFLGPVGWLVATLLPPDEESPTYHRPLGR